MHSNPFSPSFSIRPERFYGRDDDLATMREALGNLDSPNRYLFITGTRGCGKTSLLHQFSIMARSMDWQVLETTYKDALETLLAFCGASKSDSKTATLQPSVSAAGVSASLGGIAKSSTSSPSAHLSGPLVSHLSKDRRHEGLLITIDEVQKIAETDMEEICHAVQSAKTQGISIALVIAGLPAAYRKIRSYPGCTFIQRMRRRELGLMTIPETYGFLRSAFSLVPELDIAEDTIDAIASFCSGHPYLLQLVGNHLYEAVDETITPVAGQVAVVNGALVREAERRSISEYQENVLYNLLKGLHSGTLAYLKALCALSDSTSTASTSAVAQALGKTAKECSPTRARIIDLQLAEPAGHGMLRLALPYMPLAFEGARPGDSGIREDRWLPPKLPFEPESEARPIRLGQS